MVPTTNEAIILFDGICNLCNGAVRFIIRRDKRKYFRFASLQSTTAAELLKNYKLRAEDFDSIVVIANGKAYIKSDAAIFIASHLGFPWSLIKSGNIFTKSFRDSIYDLIARNRYRVFGKRETCMVPTAELKEHFL